ncbi:MAG: MW1434 family type I TA system toxin [Hyphomicrobiaceae bacterium]
MRRPYLYISIVTGELVPWVASNGDLLADDWKVLD